MAFEQKTKYVWDFIKNRNDVELIYSNNYAAFFLMWYLETNANLTAYLMEGLTYGTLSVFAIPTTIVDFCAEYMVAFPLMLLMQ